MYGLQRLNNYKVNTFAVGEVLKIYSKNQMLISLHLIQLCKF